MSDAGNWWGLIFAVVGSAVAVAEVTSLLWSKQPEPVLTLVIAAKGVYLLVHYL